MNCPDEPHRRWRSRLVLASLCVVLGASASAQTSPEIERIRELIQGGQYREAEAAARPLVAQDGPGRAEALDALVESLWRLGRHAEPETLDLARRAVTLRESGGPEGGERLANSVLSLAIIHSHREEYAAARAAFERALALRERTLGPGHKDVGRVLNAYGVMLTNIGDFEASRAALERSLAISEAANGPDSMPTAVVLTNLGNVRYATGDVTGALPIYERVLDISQRTFPQGHPYVTTALNNVAGVLEVMGDSAAARPFYEKALALNEKILGPDGPAVALDLQNLGFNLMSLGDYAAARAAFVRALAIREKKASKGEYGYTLAGFGSLLLRTGELTQSREALEKALPLLEGALGPRHPRVAEVLDLYGDVLAAQNDNQGAGAAYERVLGIWQDVFGAAGYRKLSGARRSLAWVLLARGDARGAAREGARAEEERRTFIRDTIRQLPERQALALAAEYGSALDVLLVGAAPPFAEGIPADELLDAVIRSRGLVLDEMASRHRTGFGDDAATRLMATRYVEARRRLANFLVRSAANDGVDEHLTAALLAARRDSEAAERELAAASAEFRAEQGRARAGLAEVKAALPPRSVLVSFVRHATRAGDHPPQAYTALVLRSGSAGPAIVPFGASTSIDDAVQKWRTLLLAEGTAGIRSRRSEALLRGDGEALRTALWDPVAPHLTGAERVFVVMDGPLHLVTLAALPLRATGYLVEAPYEIHYLSSERDLLPAGEERGAGLLAVGGPAYDHRPPAPDGTPVTFRSAPPDCQPFASLRFTPLPGSLAESRQVAQSFPSERSSTILSGARASEAAFKLSAPGRRVLHLATHGFILGGDCVAAGRGRSAAGFTPLTLSGLAFAGANRRESTAPGQDDGILTGEEAAALDLRGVEWTVLSACDTGLGERTAGEGVVGLRRAFQVAGARTVFSSLWPVEDESSRAWMRALYRHRFRAGRSTSSSARQASLDRLRALRTAGASTHPFYWAAFVAVGAWR